ncbi:PEP-CTERM system TPR-repeat protein PrsT [Rubrivivax gelatinosus]|nr:PEP-CTERM system TPR-repeat protein PrsT [Rubrivivax gelatinosus]
MTHHRESRLPRAAVSVQLGCASARERAARTAIVLIALFTAACGEPSSTEAIASAQSRIEKQDYPAAIVELKSALQRDPQSPRLRFLLGDVLLRLGDTAAAEVEIDKARDFGYPDEETLPKLARAMLANGKAKSVADLFSKVELKDARAAADLRTSVALAFSELGQGQESRNATRQALELDPTNIDARFLQARQTSTESAEASLSLIDRLLVDAPNRADIHFFRGQLMWTAKRDVDAAVTSFQQALKLNAAYLPAHRALSTIWLQRNNKDQFKNQVQLLQKALPKHPETEYFVTQLAFLEGDLKTAREGTSQLLKRSPDNALALELAGLIELKAGRLVVAETHLNKVLRIAPQRTSARVHLAETYLRLRQPERVLASLEPLLRGHEASSAAFALAAEAHLQMGDASRAETLFAKAAKAEPNDVRFRTAVALMKIVRGDERSGFDQLEAVAASEKSHYADLALISARMNRREFKAALSGVDRLIAKTPDMALGHEIRGRLLQQLNDIPGARRSFEKALAIDPVYLPAAVNLANIDLAAAQPQAALQRFEKVLALDPRNYRAQIGAIEVKQQSGTPAGELTPLYEAVVKTHPSDAMPRQALVHHLATIGNTNRALAAAQESIAAVPDDVVLLELLGRTQLAAREYEQALSTFGKLAVARPGVPEPYQLSALVYATRGDLPDAERSYKRALEIEPNSITAQTGLIQLALSRNDPAKALTIARTMQKQRPADPTGFALESEIHSRQRAWNPAISAALAALDRQRSPQSAGKLVALYHAANRTADAQKFVSSWEKQFPKDAVFESYLGTLAMARKDNAEAEARFRRVLELRGDDSTALNNVAWLLLEQKKPGAVPLARRANDLLPDQPTLMDTLARALAAEMSWDEALIWQRKAIAKATDKSPYRLGLARILVAKGDKQAAKRELVELAKLGPDFRQQDEVRRLSEAM